MVHGIGLLIIAHIMFSLFLFSHSLVPVLPSALVDYVQLPSTYIMGIHSSLRDKVEDELVGGSLSLSLFLSLFLSLSLSPFSLPLSPTST